MKAGARRVADGAGRKAAAARVVNATHAERAGGAPLDKNC
jgi:hypothetical protein